MRVFLWDVFFYIFHIFLLLLNDLRAHEHNKFVTKKIKKYLKQSALMTKNTESFLCVDWIKSDCNEFKRDVSSSQLWQKQNMHFGRDSKAVISNDYRYYGIRLLLFEPAYFLPTCCRPSCYFFQGFYDISLNSQIYLFKLISNLK